MKYYVLNTSQIGDSSPAIEAFSFDSLEAAKSNHYYFLSSCFANTNVTNFMSLVCDGAGSVITRESHTKEPNV